MSYEFKPRKPLTKKEWEEEREHFQHQLKCALKYTASHFNDKFDELQNIKWLLGITGETVHSDKSNDKLEWLSYMGEAIDKIYSAAGMALEILENYNERNKN